MFYKTLQVAIPLLLLFSGLAQAQNETVISLAVPEFWRNMVITDAVIDDFEAANPGVKLNVVYTYENGGTEDIEEYFDQTADYVSQADVVFVDADLLSALNTPAGYFLDLSPLTSSDASLNDFIPGVWQSFQWDNGVWALPISTEIGIITYDAAAFDAAGLSYPTPNWTIDDFANAARILAVRDSAGNVTQPGMITSGLGGGDNFALLMRALYGKGFYDINTFPTTPLFSDPVLENLLDTWKTLTDEGVVAQNLTDFEQVGNIPLRIDSSFGLMSNGGFTISSTSSDGETTTTIPDATDLRSAAMLPGDIAGLDVQGLAVSAGTQYPELAYALAKYLTTRPEVANNFMGISPARESMKGVQPTVNEDEATIMIASRPISPELQPVIDEALAKGLPVAEMRYGEYIEYIFQKMISEETDAHTMSQEVEAAARDNLQLATDRRENLVISVATPVPVVMAPGEITLNFGIGSNFVGIGMPNQAEWEQIARDFAATDPEVGQVNFEPASVPMLDNLTENYDCFTMNNNGVPGADLSSLLSLDPFLDTDPNFSREDVLGNTLAQVQRDNKTWAIPLSIQPQMLRYNPNLLDAAGVSISENGWTVSDFINALQALKNANPDVKPFVPRDPGGAYMTMLITAFGGLPIDYRTNPPTPNYTDTATMEAIRQVLDLAKQGYIDYQKLGSTMFSIAIGESDEESPAIYTDSFLPFAMGNSNEDGMMLYPRGNQYNALSYEITTGYISANAQNPEACYRWLSHLANNPQLFAGMPARRSMVSNPAVIAAQGENVVALYRQLESLMLDPNTIIVPSQFNTGGSPADFISEFWLKRAFDRYVMEDADLEAELTQAQAYVTAFLECTAAIPSADGVQMSMEYFEQFNQCATSVDPTFTLGG